MLEGRARRFRDEIYASHSGDGTMNMFPQRAVRDLRYKYILNLHPERTWTTHFTKVDGHPDSHKQVWDSWVERAKSDPAAARTVALIETHPREELYDTLADPHELTNLAAEPRHRATLERLRARLAARRRELGDQDE